MPSITALPVRRTVRFASLYEQVREVPGDCRAALKKATPWRVAEHEDFVALAQRPFIDAAGRDLGSACS
ncbi:hypothetical protein [Rhizobium leguminosarum]|uniref:hypothetical protein n=1 Tax=Rhizobium leguminosarum TaxID=384 RepID=UPI00143F3BC9|nr:hypothetical protein [Rhizobium leguminosarum]NKL19235.1 hypothetical protein [Rhizobium leguminosarum bv. viciae]